MQIAMQSFWGFEMGHMFSAKRITPSSITLASSFVTTSA
jgi:hypothetical protein